MKQSFGQKGAGGRFLALALALIMLCSVLVPAYAAAVDEQGAVENQNEPVPGVTYGVIYIFHVGETVYQQVKVLSGSVLTKPADPAPEEGKVFAYWRLADGQEFTSFGTEVSTTKDETVLLYAHFADAQPAGEAPAAEAPAQTPAAEPKAEEPKQDEPKQDEPTPEEPKQDEPKQEEPVTPVTPVTPETPAEPEPETPETPEPPAQPDAPTDVLPAEETPAEETTIVLPTEPVAPETLFAEIMACEDPVALEQLLAQAADSAEFETYLESLSEDELIAYNEKLSLLTGGENELAVYALVGNVSEIAIDDTIIQNGQFNLVVRGADKNVLKNDAGEDATAEDLYHAGYSIVWTKNKNGTTSTVTRSQRMDGKYTMDEYGQWVNVAYDDGAGATYTVTVTKDAETFTAQRTVSYSDQLENGSFEDPTVNGYVQYDEDSVPYWKTTAVDHKIEICDINSNWHNCKKAVDGDQFAELNCEYEGALYQDVLTVPGTTMHWKLSHRGREGEDTMKLVIAPIGKVGSYTEHTALKAYIDRKNGNMDKPDADGVYIQTITSGNISNKNDPNYWNTQQGSLVVPEGQFVTRFFFVAHEAKGGNSQGNLLDDVSFSTKYPPVSEDAGRITVTKNIYGLTLEQAKSSLTESFLSYREGNAAAQDISLNWEAKDDHITASFVIEKKVQGSEQIKYTFTEDISKNSHAQIPGYTFTLDESVTQNAVLYRKGDVSVTFTNRYTRSTSSLTVSKKVLGVLGDPEKPFSFRYSYSDANGQKTGTFSLTDGESTTAETVSDFQSIPIGTTVTIEETDNGGYTTWFEVGKDKTKTDENVTTYQIEIKADAEENVLLCVNKKEGTPDTGIFLDSWPYFVALALVAAGAVLQFARRRRDAD